MSPKVIWGLPWPKFAYLGVKNALIRKKKVVKCALAAAAAHQHCSSSTCFFSGTERICVLLDYWMFILNAQRRNAVTFIWNFCCNFRGPLKPFLVHVLVNVVTNTVISIMTNYSGLHLRGIRQLVSSKTLVSEGVWDRIKTLGISRYGRGTRGGTNLQRLVPTWITTRSQPAQYVNNANINNLVQVQCDNYHRIATSVITTIG